MMMKQDMINKMMVMTMTGAPKELQRSFKGTSKEHQRRTIAGRWLRYAAMLVVAMTGSIGVQAADYVLKSLA